MPAIPPAPTAEQITLVVKGYSFQLIVPYSAGQVLGVAEAGILNREWTHSVRKGFQGSIENAIEHSSGQLSHAQIAAIQLDFQHYADEFSFKALSQTQNSDPLTKQKHSVAKQILDIRLNAAGATRQSFGENKYQDRLARLMNNPEVIRQAEQQLAATREAADQLAGMEEQT